MLLVLVAPEVLMGAVPVCVVPAIEKLSLPDVAPIVNAL
jgi:hypothetical protein